MGMFSGLPKCKVVRTPRLAFKGVSVTDRQERAPGFLQKRLSSATIGIIGAGGLGGEVAEGLVRKGVGTIWITDHDTVDPTNLNRQRFYRRDIGHNKAICLARNLRREGTSGTTIIAYPCTFQRAIQQGADLSADIIYCGVDNSATRLYVARYSLQHSIPVVFSAVDALARAGYVFVQEPEGACLACLFPHILTDDRQPCPATPAVKDILKSVGGVALYAIDSLLMRRARAWNYFFLDLSGLTPPVVRRQSIRERCSLCGGKTGRRKR